MMNRYQKWHAALCRGAWWTRCEQLVRDAPADAASPFAALDVALLDKLPPIDALQAAALERWRQTLPAGPWRTLFGDFDDQIGRAHV